MHWLGYRYVLQTHFSYEKGQLKKWRSSTFTGKEPPFVSCCALALPLELSSDIIEQVDTLFFSGILINILMSAADSMDLEEPS